MKYKPILAVVVVAAILASLALLVWSRGSKEETPVIASPWYTMTASRANGVLSVSDSVSDAECRYTPKRARRRSGAVQSAQRAITSVNTKTLQIESVFDLLIIVEKSSGQRIFFKVR